jgi:hypothetical protein
VATPAFEEPSHVLVAERDGRTFGQEHVATFADIRAANANEDDVLAAVARLERGESTEEVVAGFVGTAFRFRIQSVATDTDGPPSSPAR